MRLTFCAACGSTHDLDHVHLVSRGKGGQGNDQNLITLCRRCRVHLRPRTKADAFAESVRPILDSLGDMTYGQKAEEMNARGLPTPMGRQWTRSTVLRVLQRTLEGDDG